MTDEAMQIWKEACKAGANAYYAAGEQPNDPEGVKQSAILHKAAAAVIAEALAAKDARIAEQAKEIERLASLALEQPCEPGSFAGDIWYGHPEKRTLGTHRWDGSAWQELPSEIEGCLSLLADARARIAALTAEVARKDEALRRLAYWFETDEDYLETLSEAERTDNNRMLSIARAALDARND